MRRRGLDGPGSIARALRSSQIDLNPHQVEAAVSALAAIRERGLVLADEVGLGKTIEAGLVLAQLAAEGNQRLLVLSPASLRKQWARELEEKLGLSSAIVDGRVQKKSIKEGARSVFEQEAAVVIASHQFAGRNARELSRIRWGCVVIDEAHRLRGAHRGSKTASALRDALCDRPKLLLTATPLQNGLSELYGILSLLDAELLGPFDEFRRMFPDRGALDHAEQLRERIQPHIHRTLRRQVREYVRYTDRKSIVCEFNPTAEEAGLYDEISDYFDDPDTLAIDPARRHLMVLVYRKLLASSPAAIGATLGRLADGLRARLEDGDCDPEEDEDVRAILQELEDDGLGELEEEKSKPTRPPATPSRLQAEIVRLDRLAKAARGIVRPAKMVALLTALESAFLDATARGWPKKAVIFTESRRTQDALQAALEGQGLIVATMNGQSGDADARAAIVDDFRDRANVLILTEAGAEGLNLQFANLVVNYDLPWNPQRIEQRIGRCHRYGQMRDVVVLNFLASENAAESRLYELLSEKLRLFDGVFGATDEPLGALGDGAEFERRVFDIFKSCRSEAEVSRAFDALRSDVEERIEARMSEARSQICEHFDDEIRARLRMTEANTGRALDQDEAELVTLVQGALPSASIDDEGRLHLPNEAGGLTLETKRGQRTKGADFLTVDHPLAHQLIEDIRTDSPSDIRYVSFEYTRGGHKISRLAPLLGSEGWWLCYRLSFDGALAEDHLVHVAIVKTADGRVVALDEAQIESLLGVRSVDIEKRARLRAATLASSHADEVLEPKIERLATEGRGRAEEATRRAKERVELWFEDRLAALRAAVEEAQQAWRRSREKGDEADAQRRFRDLSRAMTREAEGRDRALERRKERLAEVERQAQLEVNRTLVATAYFWLD